MSSETIIQKSVILAKILKQHSLFSDLIFSQCLYSFLLTFHPLKFVPENYVRFLMKI
jgi:hypothetical protein